MLEGAGLVTTEKVGRVRTCRLGPRRLEDEAAWIDRLPADARRRASTGSGNSSSAQREMTHDMKQPAAKGTRHHADRPRDPHRAHLQRTARPRLAGVHRSRAGRAVVGARQQARDRAHGRRARRTLALRRAQLPKAARIRGALSRGHAAGRASSRPSNGTGCRAM